MTTKSITITAEAYERLASLKEKTESFSEIITKLTGKYSLMDLIGLLSNDEAKELKEAVRNTSKRIRKKMETTAEALQ